MAILDVVKKDIRITHSKLDDDLTLTIDACKNDLGLAGVIDDDSKPLISKAICLYCRWDVDYQGQGDRYLNAYNALKTALSLTGDYLVKEDASSG